MGLLYTLFGIGRKECSHRYAAFENCPHCAGQLKRKSLSAYIEDQAQRQVTKYKEYAEEDKISLAIKKRTQELLDKEE